MTLGMNGKSTTLYRVVFGQARDGVSACAIAEKSTPKSPANAITGTNVAVRMITLPSMPQDRLFDAPGTAVMQPATRCHLDGELQFVNASSECSLVRC
jgi:hypothetical protein